MSLTTTPSRPAVTKVNDKVISSHKPEKIGKPNNRDDLIVVSENRNVKELKAAMERLETEEKLIRELLENSDGEVSISPRAFKEEDSSSNTATVVKMLVENKSSHFKQYCDSFYALNSKVSDEYKKWVSEEKTKVIESVECIKEHIGEESSKNVENSEEFENTESAESSESSEGSLISISSTDSECSRKSKKMKFTYNVDFSDQHDEPQVKFDLDMDSFYRSDRKKIINFSKYCRELARRLIQFKRTFALLPLNFSVVQYRDWKRQVTHVFHSKILACPSRFKLVDQLATSKKMEVYLKTACELTTKLFNDLPCEYSDDIDGKRREVGYFAKTCGPMGTLLENLYGPLYKIALMLQASIYLGFGCNEVMFEFNLSEIFNFVSNFKNDLDADLPYRQDVIQWACDLRDFIFEMCCCKPCLPSVV